MTKADGSPMPPNPYRKNETMRLLGYQTAGRFWCNSEVRMQIEHIAEARPCTFTLEAAADIFNLGYIHGMRAERARKKNNN